MATTTKNPEPIVEKETRHYDEKTDLESIKPVAGGGNADYTGSVAKTDPREIALVRKIDWRLMVGFESGIEWGERMNKG